MRHQPELKLAPYFLLHRFIESFRKKAEKMNPRNHLIVRKVKDNRGGDDDQH